mgnify:FL=1
MDLMLKLDQKGVAQIVLLLILLIGIAVTVWGVQYGRTVLKPKAFEPGCEDNICYWDGDPKVQKWIHKYGGYKDNRNECVYNFVQEDSNASCEAAVAAEEQRRQSLPEDQRVSAAKVCIPGEFNKIGCTRCNASGTGYDAEGSYWGPSEGPDLDTYCVCAEKYSTQVLNPREFTKDNFPNCTSRSTPDEFEKVSCVTVGKLSNVSPPDRTSFTDKRNIVTLEWRAPDNAASVDKQEYLVRVTQLQGGIFDTNSSFEVNNTPKDCDIGNKDTYICISRWKGTSMSIYVDDGAKYSWHVTPLDGDGNECKDRYSPATEFTTAPASRP